MTRTPPTYGRRGSKTDTNSGIRRTASTYGKAKYGTYNEKANGHIILESEAERFVTHLFALDPNIVAFQTQPFSVDLIDQRLLLTKEAVSDAWYHHRNTPGPFLYTPDFSVEWDTGLHHSFEVKAEGYEGDDSYWDKIERARPVLEANGYPLRTLVFPSNPSHPIRMNAWLLKQASHQTRTYLTNELIDRVTAYCEFGPVLMRELCADLELAPGLIPILLVNGVLEANLMSHAIGGMLKLSLAEGSLGHLCLLEGVEK